MPMPEIYVHVCPTCVAMSYAVGQEDGKIGCGAAILH